MDRIRRLWVRLGGLSLFLSLYIFYQTRRGPKIAFLLRYYTIAAGKKFLGKTLDSPYTLEPGWIIEVRQGPDGSPVWYHFRSLYEFVRSFEHAQRSEEDAQGDVEVSIDVALEIVRDLLALWPLTFSQRRRLIRKLGELRVRFARARKPVLREAHVQVEGAAGFKDRLDRPNPSASAARISAASRRYTVRFSEITSIVPNLSRLYVLAAQELARIHRVFLERDLTILQQVRQALPRCTKEQHIRWVVSCLRQVRADLATVRVSPFYRNARYMEAEIGKIFSILFNRSQAPAQRARAVEATVRTMICSLAFKRAQQTLEALIRELSMRMRMRACSHPERERFAKRIEEYARRAQGLKENGFKRKRLGEVRKKLARAAELLREGETLAAKEHLKEVSALL